MNYCIVFSAESKCKNNANDIFCNSVSIWATKKFFVFLIGKLLKKKWENITIKCGIFFMGWDGNGCGEKEVQGQGTYWKITFSITSSKQTISFNCTSRKIGQGTFFE